MSSVRTVVSVALVSAVVAAAPATAAHPGVATLTALPASAGAQTVPGCSPEADLTDTTPVIYVHGWLGSGPGSQRYVDLLQEALGEQHEVLAFDYQERNNEWPIGGKTPRCLDNYVTEAAVTSGQAAIVVAHSMGGIMAREAAATLGDPDALAGIVTLGTPHLGSPWGGTTYSGLLQGATNYIQNGWFEQAGLPRKSSASHCLALTMPCGTAAALPGDIELVQIGSQITVERRLFGLNAFKASVPLFGDTIVPLNSAQGYLHSTGGHATPGTVSAYTVSCTINDGDMPKALAEKFPGTFMVGRWVQDNLAFWADATAVDALADGRADVSQLPLMVGGIISDCFHTTLPQHPEAFQLTVSEILAMPHDAYTADQAGDALTYARVQQLLLQDATCSGWDDMAKYPEHPLLPPPGTKQILWCLHGDRDYGFGAIELFEDLDAKVRFIEGQVWQDYLMNGPRNFSVVEADTQQEPLWLLHILEPEWDAYFSEVFAEHGYVLRPEVPCSFEPAQPRC